jgi:hypothetical protein
MNALEELHVLVTNSIMYCYKKPTIDIAYNHIICDRSKYIDVAYHVVCENVESG